MLAQELRLDLDVLHGHIGRFIVSGQELRHGDLAGRRGFLPDPFDVVERQAVDLQRPLLIDGEGLVEQIHPHLVAAGEFFVVAGAVKHQAGFSVGDDDRLGGSIVVQSAVGVPAVVADHDAFNGHVVRNLGVGAGVAVADFLDRHEFRLALLPAEALAGQAGDIAQRSEAELHLSSG